jgi:predicted DNA-binding WGR domain protein
MRRFELVEGSSSKFWEVGVADGELTVRFGRIGTAGQSKTKSFADRAAAEKERDALIKEKLGKGYAETGAAGAAPAQPAAAAPAVPAAASAPAAVPAVPARAAAQAAPAKAQAPTATPTPAPVIEPLAQPATEAPPTAIEWPRGGFQWDDDHRAQLPLVRGIHAASTMLSTEGLWDEAVVLADDEHGHFATLLAGIAQAAGRSWSLWGPQRSAELMRREHLARDDAEFWLELCAQTAAAPTRRSDDRGYLSFWHRSGLSWATRAGIALHGLPFAVDLALQMAQFTHGQNTFNLVKDSMLDTLRAAITACSPADHDAVIALLDARAAGTAADRLVRAYLCPHRGDWAAASAADALPDPYMLLKDCALPLEQARAYLMKGEVHVYYLASSLLLQLHLHGEPAFDLLAWALRGTQDRTGTDQMLVLVMRMWVPQQIHLLVELIERKEVRAVLDKVAGRYPAAVLHTVVAHALATRSRLAEGWAVRLALREPAALAQVLPALPASERERFQALLQSLQRDEAAPEDLPPLLREPPWLGKARAAELPTLELPPQAPADRLDWTEAERARHAAFKPSGWRASRAAGKAEDYWFNELKITPAGRTRVLAGQPLQPGDVAIPEGYWSGELPEVLMLLPDAAALAVWNSYPAQHWYTWMDGTPAIWALLARFGTAAVPGLAQYAQARPEEGLRIALPVDSARVVPAALHALRNLKKAKPPAIEWLRAHAATALAAALPLAFGKDKAQRDNAQAGLRWMVQNGFADAAREAAAAQGAAMSQALQALLDADPLLVLPSRMPKLPAFFVAPSLRRPELRDGGALPAAALEHIASMLAISKLEAPYAGLDVVREACTPASLAEFAWDVFEAWVAAGSPSKEGWAFTALGLLGNDETARRLAPRIREWPGESQHQRAVAGLDLLAAIGSDVALMHLNGIAGKVKFKALQDRAKEKIAAVAEARGFTAAELADRLVPDLGLDEQGTLVLDFGPRRFSVSFDETLKPFVKDVQGVRLKDLPKPVKSDDAALAEAATERYKQVKKDAKAVASLQVVRLEQGMVARRRWSAADFRLFFLEHPLMRHLAARLVWGVYEGGVLAGGFRVAEDWTLADAQDTLYELPDAATVGIAHVLEMPAPLQAAFGQILADYEILQPFRQLGRETFALTPEELKASTIKRFADKLVATGSVMGLVNRGWERGQAQDAGWVGWFRKEAGDGMEVQIELDPGTVVGDPTYEPKQRIPGIVLRRTGTWDSDGHVSFDKLDPILASEVLRDVALLAPFKE